jgi:SulP family sulfate permease
LTKTYHPLYEKVLLVFRSLDETNLFALALAVLTIGIILVCRKISRNLPGSLIALVASAAAVALLGLEGKGLKLVGDIPRELPGFALFPVSFARGLDIFGSALAIAIVGLVEAISIAKSIALSSEQRLQPNREFIGQGLANLVGAFFRCMPASGSFTRSVINYQAQARTRLAGILSGVLVALVLVFCAPYARFIPNASLAAVIVVVAVGMVDKQHILRVIRAGRQDAAVMFITLGATVIMPDLEKAILTGIAVSVITHLWNTGEVSLKLLHSGPGGGFRESDLPDSGVYKPDEIPIIHVEGNLYFGSAGDLEDKLATAADALAGRVIILRLKRVHVLDLSAFEIIENFIDRALRHGKVVLLCGVSASLKSFLDRTGITAKVGAENIFLAEEMIYASCAKAYRHGLEVAGEKMDGKPQNTE